MPVVSRNPATGDEVFSCAAFDRDMIDAASRSAVHAQRDWAALPVAARAEILRAFAERLDDDRDETAALITREVGKLRGDALAEVEWTAMSARWYADHPPPDERVDGARVRRRPLGVIAAITPWNVPLVTPSWKWLPALMAGNAVLWKPSELATATALRAAEMFRDAGLTDGLLTVVPGAAEAAETLCLDSRVAGVHFTGSTQTGAAIAAMVAPRFARYALEMGGVNTALVFPDAELDDAARAIVESAVALGGQKCTSIRRVVAHESIADDLLDLLTARLDALVPGDPADPTTTIGPLITPRARYRAEQVVTEALARGCRVAARSPECTVGAVDTSAFFRATIITDVLDGDPLEHEEVFAPIVTLQRFTEAGDAWRLAQANGYGLTAAVYTRDPALATEAADRLSTGVLAVNGRSDAVGLAAPFGGRGISGSGLPEGGSYAYAAVTDLQAVYDASGTKART